MNDLIRELMLSGIVPEVNLREAADAVPFAQALKACGLHCAEVLYSDTAVDVICSVKNAYSDLIVGAGHIRTLKQAEEAVSAGADYLAMTGINREIVSYCQNMGMPVFPGVSTPSETETALSFGLNTLIFFPAEAAGGKELLCALASAYKGVSFIPAGGLNDAKVAEYLRLPNVLCCIGDWMVPADALDGKDWSRLEALVHGSIQQMLGLEIAHLGINSENEEEAMKTATLLCRMFGWPIRVGMKSIFSGTAFEVMKRHGPGTHGHVAIRTNFIERAVRVIENYGFTFDQASAGMKDGKMTSIYLKEEVAGFGIHLLQK